MFDNSYQRAAPYEIFMCRAFNNWDNSKPGFHMCYMQNLIKAEEGNSINTRYIGSHEKQLANVKKYMLKALLKYKQKKNLPPERLQVFDYLIKKLELSDASDKLLDIIKVTLEITQKDK